MKSQIECFGAVEIMCTINFEANAFVCIVRFQGSTHGKLRNDLESGLWRGGS